jgi:hypothetical protein
VEGQRKRNVRWRGRETKHVLDVEKVGQEPFLLRQIVGEYLISCVLLDVIW